MKIVDKTKQEYADHLDLPLSTAEKMLVAGIYQVIDDEEISSVLAVLAPIYATEARLARVKKADLIQHALTVIDRAYSVEFE